MFYRGRPTPRVVRRKVIGVIIWVCLGFVVAFWFNHMRDQMMQHSSAPFVSIPSPVGYDANTVLIYAPLHCPSSAARYADKMEKELSQQKIPASRINRLEFQLPATDIATKEKIDALLTGDAPVVIVKGRAKGNPATNEVINEYNRP